MKPSRSPAAPATPITSASHTGGERGAVDFPLPSGKAGDGLIRSWVRFWFTPADPVGLHVLRLRRAFRLLMFLGALLLLLLLGS